MPSYSPVFSSQFILYGDSSGALDFLVPAGFTAVIRDASLAATYSAAIGEVAVQNSDAAPAVTVIVMSGVELPFYAQWQGRVVAPAGATISATISDLGTDVSCYVGGYLLRNTLT